MRVKVEGVVAVEEVGGFVVRLAVDAEQRGVDGGEVLADVRGIHTASSEAVGADFVSCSVEFDG